MLPLEPSSQAWPSARRYFSRLPGGRDVRHAYPVNAWLRIVGWLLWGPLAASFWTTVAVLALLGAYALWNRLWPPDVDEPAIHVSKRASELAGEVEDYLRSLP